MMQVVAVWARIIWALMQREALTRFGRNRLGYLWALIEPSVYVLLFVGFRTFIADSAPFGDSIVLFVLTGVMTFRTAANIAKRSVGAITANQALLTYPLVKTFDVVVARIALEAITMVTLFLLFLVGLEVFAGVRSIPKPEELTAAIGATVLLGTGIGFFNATFARIAPFWERVWSLLQMPLFIASGIFFIPSALSPELQALASINPFLHCVEWVREASYLDYRPVLDRGYVLTFALLTLLTGLVFNRFFQHRILVE